MLFNQQQNQGMEIDTKRTKREIITNTNSAAYHEIDLKRLHDGERYIISNVLGVTKIPPEIEKVQVDTSRFATLSSMHSRGSHHGSFGSLHAGSRTDSSGALKKSSSKKKVGFKNVPNTFKQQHRETTPRQSINLDSSDGVIVASAFLPVHVRRSDDGVWSAEWDYEALLSMQTHLRVTRVGIVKWRGWHGNKGDNGSPEAGVPIDEREKVEQCLRPFHCVPVWCEPSLFGEM